MTHVDDLYEPNDRGPEPDVEHPEPVNLDEVAELLQKAENATVRDEQEEAERELIEKAVPQMIDEIGDLRLRIAEFEALPTREDWTVTDGPSVTPGAGGLLHTPDAALSIAARDGKQAWRRIVTHQPVVVRDWEPIELDAPF